MNHEPRRVTQTLAQFLSGTKKQEIENKENMNNSNDLISASNFRGRNFLAQESEKVTIRESADVIEMDKYKGLQIS